MKKLHQTIFIEAPREKVWDTMLTEPTYSEWTLPFSPTPGSPSRVEGDWSEGSEMRFIGVGEEGEEGGMAARVKENRRHEFISLEHYGIIKDGEVDTESEEVKKWAPAFENYTLEDADGGTQVTIDMDIAEEYEVMFGEMWVKALQKLKEIAER